MNHLPFNKPGRFWKGNLHTHCTKSDGRLTTEQVCQKYQDAGYDFLAITNHFLHNYNYPITDTRHLRTESFTTLIGAELHVPTTEMGEMWHIVAIGLPMDFAPPSNGESGSEIAARARATGAYVSIAHPNRCVMTEQDAHALGPVHGIEIYNGGSHDENDRADSWSYLEVLLGRGKRYFAHAADDFHGIPYRRDFGMGWVQVKSESLAPEALLDALKAGHFYASTGPEIYDIQVEPGKKITIRSSPVDSIFVSGDTARAKRVHGDGITEAEFSLAGFPSPYCRVTVRTGDGKRAWSNAIALNPNWFTQY
ncbi:MAG: CehA/McbA family metallohydrolase [Chloroflexota bacterium]